MIPGKKILILLAGLIVLASCEKDEDAKYPDLSAIQLFSSQTLAPGASIQEVIIINNAGSSTTEQVSFTVSRFPANSGLTLALNNNAGVKIGNDTFALSTKNWDTTGTASEITFKSKPGVVINGGYATYIGLTISRAGAPNPGASGAVTQTVKVTEGTGGNERPTSNNTVTATLTKTSAADLVASQFFSTLQIAAGGTIEQVILIRNLGTGPTTGPISFTVSNYDAASGLSAVSNNNPTVTIGIDTYNLTNAADWDVSVGSSTLNFTSKTGVIIPAGGSKMVGVTIRRAAAPNQGASGNVIHTTSIVPGTGGGEAPATNNTVFSTIFKI